MQYKHIKHSAEKDQVQAGWCWLVLYHSLLCECLLHASGVNISMAEYDACKGVRRSCIRIQHITPQDHLSGEAEEPHHSCSLAAIPQAYMCRLWSVATIYWMYFYSTLGSNRGWCVHRRGIFVRMRVWSRRGLALIALVVRAPVTCDTRIHQSMM